MELKDYKQRERKLALRISYEERVIIERKLVLRHFKDYKQREQKLALRISYEQRVIIERKLVLRHLLSLF